MSDSPTTMYDIPPSSVILRFGMQTPYWSLTLSYGVFGDPATRMHFASVDHWLGYHQLVKREDRERLMKTPNGFLAHSTLQRILEESGGPEDVIVPTWENDRDAILDEGLRLKYTQSTFLTDMLVRTRDRQIVDDSRQTELYMCFAGGRGANAHGKALMRLRRQLIAGTLPLNGVRTA